LRQRGTAARQHHRVASSHVLELLRPQRKALRDHARSALPLPERAACRGARAPHVRHQRGRRIRAAHRRSRHRQDDHRALAPRAGPEERRDRPHPQSPHDAARVPAHHLRGARHRGAGPGRGEPEGPGRHPRPLPAARPRLRVAGATADILSPHALNEVFRLSHGVPRVINIVCDRSLLGAYSLDRHRVTAALVRSAASEVFGRRIAPHWLPWALGGTLAAALAAATFALWNLAPWGAGARGAHLARADTVVPAAAASAVGTATSAPAAPREPHLGELLTRYAADTDTDSAFDRLLSLWGAHYERNTTDPCTQAMRQGLEC